MHSPSPFFEVNKMIKNISIAVLLASMILMASPMAAAQAITATTNKTSYVPGDSLVVSGTGPANDDVSITVTNPRGNLIGVAQGKVGSNNQYSVTVLAFPSAESQTFPFGAYSIRVTAAAAGASTTVTVNFLATAGPEVPITPSTGAGGFLVAVHAAGTYFPGDRVRIYAIFTNNGALADPTAFTVSHVHRMDNTIDQLLGTQQRIHAGWYYFDYTVPATAPAGTYGVHVAATLGTSANNADSAFQVQAVNRDVAAIANNIAAVSQAVSGLSTALTAQGTRLTAIENGVTAARTAITGRIDTLDGAITSRLNALQGAVGTQITAAQNNVIQRVDGITAGVTAVQNSQTAVTKAVTDGFSAITTTLNGVQADVRSSAAGTAQSSTFVLVIAGLAALSVVLQIAILARKRA
jgi:hypothetical protein